MDTQQYLKGLLSHDSEVLNAVYADFAERIRHLIVSKGGTEADAKDVFHDALMVIYQKAQSPDFQLTAGFYTYLYSICRFIWDRKRKKKANNTVTFPEDDGLVLEEDIEEDILRREKQVIFRENLQKLGEFCRNILRAYFNGENMSDIARSLDLKNAHTARTRKYRCQKELETLIKSDARYRELSDELIKIKP